MKEILKVTKDPNISSPFPWEQEHSYKQQRREMHSMDVVLAPDLGMQQHEILILYQNYKNIFEKKNANTLPKHRPYNYVINLEEGA
jgi:hypothetical protein